jgi:hypothetical protein
MAERVTCPGCQQTLVIPAGSRNRWLTCPRCLSPVANPQAVAPGAIQAEAPARAPAADVYGVQAEPDPPLAERVRRGAAGIDVDVRRDTRATSGCLILLAVLGALGIGLLFLGALGVLAEGESGPLVTLAVGLFVLGLISAGIVAARGSGGERFAGRVVLGTLALSGGLILFLLAILVFAFVVCMATFSGRFH